MNCFFFQSLKSPVLCNFKTSATVENFTSAPAWTWVRLQRECSGMSWALFLCLSVSFLPTQRWGLCPPPPPTKAMGRGEEGKEGAGRFQLDCCSDKVGTWPSVWLRHVEEIFLGGESTRQVVSYGAFCQDRLQRCPHSELWLAPSAAFTLAHGKLVDISVVPPNAGGMDHIHPAHSASICHLKTYRSKFPQTPQHTSPALQEVPLEPPSLSRRWKKLPAPAGTSSPPKNLTLSHLLFSVSSSALLAGVKWLVLAELVMGNPC